MWCQFYYNRTNISQSALQGGFGGWLPFYYSPTFEFVAGDPSKAYRIASSNVRNARQSGYAGEYV